MENLWPKFEKKQEVTPKSIILEQADYFNSLGTGLRADVSTVQAAEENDMFGIGDKLDQVHTFRITATELSSFTFTLFRAKHKITSLYPVSIYDNMTSIKYENLYQEELKPTLSKIFTSKNTVEAINNLMAQLSDSEF